MAVLLRFSSVPLMTNWRIGMLAGHADWSVDARKRWMTLARRRAGHWHVTAPEPVGEPSNLIERLLVRAGNAPVGFGVDFPLGLPRFYATRAGIGDFRAWLRGLDPASPFFAPCASLGEVGLERPFYPKSSIAGAGQMALLAERLGLSGADALRRDVDWPTARRPGAAPLFWTMGANQCGKAGLAAWRDCLLPAMRAGLPLDLWPYAGRFVDVLAGGRIVLAETYPAEAMVQLGIPRLGSKRRQADRAGLAPAIGTAMVRLGAVADDGLAAMLDNGFGAAPDGEDRFDSLLGALNVIAVIDGAPDGVPDDPVIRAVEGWVLGQVDPPRFPIPASDRPAPFGPPPRVRRSRRADPLPAGSG